MRKRNRKQAWGQENTKRYSISLLQSSEKIQPVASCLDRQYGTTHTAKQSSRFKKGKRNVPDRFLPAPSSFPCLSLVKVIPYGELTPSYTCVVARSPSGQSLPHSSASESWVWKEPEPLRNPSAQTLALEQPCLFPGKVWLMPCQGISFALRESTIEGGQGDTCGYGGSPPRTKQVDRDPGGSRGQTNLQRYMQGIQ